MRLRYWTALVVVIGFGTTLAVREMRQTTPADAPSSGLQETAAPVETAADDSETAPSKDPSDAERAQESAPENETLVTWSRVVGAGESLDILLSKAGLDTLTRAEVAAAIGSEFDLRKLKPGHRLDLGLREDGFLRLATLEIDNGFNIRAVFGDTPSVAVLPPVLDTQHRAGETEIRSSIYAALDRADIPTRFATDLELVFSDTLDLQRTLVGGEHLRVAWREHHLDGRVIGDAIIDFVELDLGDARYEVIWPDDTSRQTYIYKDGTPLLTFTQPINGARLSSPFGLREHPVHDTVRMHEGVDFAAEEGAAVLATQAGRVSFVGRKAGYGTMVEVEHTGNIRTVYAHLSATNAALTVGQRIPAGHEVGSVGSTGTSTGPHLHYEVVVDGQPVSPLTDTRLPESGSATPAPAIGTRVIEGARNQLASLLAGNG
jgi:murein DD-endopeptidase MepM/ murein hydrolase activator NlpD